MIVLVSLAKNPIFMCIMATPEDLESTSQIGGIGDFTNLRFIKIVEKNLSVDEIKRILEEPAFQTKSYELYNNGKGRS